MAANHPQPWLLVGANAFFQLENHNDNALFANLVSANRNMGRIPNFSLEGRERFESLVMVLLHSLSPSTQLYEQLRGICQNQTISRESILALETPEKITQRAHGFPILHARTVFAFAETYQAHHFEGPDIDIFNRMIEQYYQIGPEVALALIVFGLQRLNFIPIENPELRRRLEFFFPLEGQLDGEVDNWHPFKGVAAWLMWPNYH